MKPSRRRILVSAEPALITHLETEHMAVGTDWEAVAAQCAAAGGGPYRQRGVPEGSCIGSVPEGRDVGGLIAHQRGQVRGRLQGVAAVPVRLQDDVC